MLTAPQRDLIAADEGDQVAVAVAVPAPMAAMPSHARALTRSTIGSILATGTEFINLPLLIHVFHAPPAFAYFFVQFFATMVTFAVNRWWAFEAHTGNIAGQTVRYGIVFAGSLAWNTGLSSLLHYVFHFQPVLAFAISQVIVYLAWNYPLNRYFVFRRKHASMPRSIA